MKKSFTLFVCLFIWSWASQAQTNFKPGLVVTTSGDTLRGLIDHQEWLQNPKAIVFKTAASSTEQKFSPDNSSYMEVLGLEAYQSATVSISQASTSLSNLSYGADTTTVHETVFLKVLFSGASVSLYSYNDPIKTRFYVPQAPGTSSLHELLYRRHQIVGQTNKITTLPLYQNQLWTLALQNGTSSDNLLKEIKQSDYKKDDLIYLVRQINSAEVQEDKRSVSFDKAHTTRFLAGVWLNRTTMQSGHLRLEGAKEKASYSPRISAGVDIFANPNTQRLFLRTELSVTTAAPEVIKRETIGSSAVHDYSYTYRQIAASINPQVLFNLYNGQRVKLHVGAGLIATKANYSKDTYSYSYLYLVDQSVITTTIENYETPSTLWYSYTARAGLTLFQKWDVSVLYTTHDISKRVNYTIDNQSINVGVSYLL